MTPLEALAAAYTIVVLATWVTVARDYAFSTDKQGRNPGEPGFEYMWGSSFVAGFVYGVFWLPFLLLWGLRSVRIPWERWPIKMANEREGLARIREIRMKEIEREVGLDK